MGAGRDIPVYTYDSQDPNATQFYEHDNPVSFKGKGADWKKAIKSGQLDLVQMMIAKYEDKYDKAKSGYKVNKAKSASAVLENLYGYHPGYTAAGQKVTGLWSEDSSTFTGYMQGTGLNDVEGYPSGEGPPPATGSGVKDQARDPTRVGAGRNAPWRDWHYPDDNLTDYVLKGNQGDTKLALMAMQNALEGREAGVDQLVGFDQEVQDKMGKPIVSQEDLAQMLSVASGQVANVYQNQSTGLQHRLGAQGSAQSGAGRELAASLRYNALSDDANRGIQTRIKTKEINRGGIERMLGVRTGLQGGIANLMAGQPLTNTGSTAASLIAARNAPGPSSNFFAQPEGQATLQFALGLMDMFSSGSKAGAF